MCDALKVNPSTATEILLMRHGQTGWSRSGRHTGNTDIALTPTGLADAERWRPLVSGREFAHVFCSPLRRARETCAAVGLDERAELRDELREWDYGDYEGLTSVEIHAADPDWNLWRDGCPGGESPGQVAERCDRMVSELLALTAGDDAAGDVIVFAHGHILRCLAARWCGWPLDAGEHLKLSTATLSTLSFEHVTPAIQSWNQTP